MRIALIGYGKMGRLVEEIAKEKEHSIVAKIHPRSPSTKKITAETLRDADLCIDFSNPKYALENIKQVAALGKSLVMGTTGWYDHLDEVKALVEKSKIGFIYSPNFSVGVNLFVKMVGLAAAMINEFDEYDVGGIEMHHNEKVDSPSGTAKALAHEILKHFKRKNSIVYETVNRQINPNELQISSLRCGSIPGKHSIIFDSPSDSITLTHEARNREGFASGAVAAAEWLSGKTGFYTIQDMLYKL
jgi:4-hydroxy-tetrahydrodipicolinate reductase